MLLPFTWGSTHNHVCHVLSIHCIEEDGIIPPAQGDAGSARDDSTAAESLSPKEICLNRWLSIISAKVPEQSSTELRDGEDTSAASVSSPISFPEV